MASIYLRGETWWAKFRQGGKVIRTSTGCTTKRAAKDWVDIRAGKIAAGDPVPVKLDAILYDELHRDLLTHYETVGRLTARGGTLRSLPHVKRRMSHLLRHFRGWRAINVTESAVLDYIATRQRETVPGSDRRLSGPTINRELSALKSALRLAASRTQPKLARVPKVPLLAESAPRQGFVEEADFATIAQHLEPGLALAATIAFETAWRCKSEVLTLAWSRVDLAEGSIKLDGAHSKNGQTRTAYLSPATTRLLAAQRATVEALQRKLGRVIPDVFVHTDKGPLQGKQQGEFRKAWRTATRRAGYPGVLLHDLRRSGIRAMVRSGTPESVCMKISGHTTAQIFKRYDITSDQDLRDARDRRAQFGHNQAAKVVSIAR
jgi:integrase